MSLNVKDWWYFGDKLHFFAADAQFPRKWKWERVNIILFSNSTRVLQWRGRNLFFSGIISLAGKKSESMYLASQELTFVEGFFSFWEPRANLVFPLSRKHCEWLTDKAYLSEKYEDIFENMKSCFVTIWRAIIVLVFKLIKAGLCWTEILSTWILFNCEKWKHWIYLNFVSMMLLSWKQSSPHLSTWLSFTLLNGNQ